GDALQPGEVFEVEIQLRTASPLRYVALEDPKPAGCEPVDQQSTGLWSGTWLYRELRECEVRFFAEHLLAGRTTIRYALRAESPGWFHALPVQTWCMYNRATRARSGETVVLVADE